MFILEQKPGITIAKREFKPGLKDSWGIIALGISILLMIVITALWVVFPMRLYLRRMWAAISVMPVRMRGVLARARRREGRQRDESAIAIPFSSMTGAPANGEAMELARLEPALVRNDRGKGDFNEEEFDSRWCSTAPDAPPSYVSPRDEVPPPYSM
ncbi:uncharacterized protein BDV14DRAFT_205751 [Aspergillus stella-maris]|uniref:uncharacterized protein n=1 Tax=Aspergillus stella-maris TaxID=1810926 RepID=UPI003CCCA220